MRERGERGETTVATIVGILIAVMLLFILPMLSVAQMNDQEILATMKVLAQKHLDSILSNGSMTQEDLDTFIQELNSLGYSFEVDYEVHIADVNPGKKTENQQMGDTTSYYILFDAQLEQIISENGRLNLKAGDYIVVYVTITSETMSQMFTSVLYGLTGDQSYLMSVQVSGTCTATGY